MTNKKHEFDELQFFAKVKNCPAMFMGKKSLLSFKDQLFGMGYAFCYCCEESPFKYFNMFTKLYQDEVIKDGNGYAAWWNHMLYISGNFDDLAFDLFFKSFEQYLHDVHDVSLPELP